MSGFSSPARSRFIRPLIAVGITVAVAVVIIWLTSEKGSTTVPATSVSPQSFVLPRLNGNGEVRLSDFKGRPLVLNFFASWCTPCRGELPALFSMSQRLRGRITFAAVNSYESGDGLAMARGFHIDSWPLARDVEGTQASGLHDAIAGDPGMPVTAFYDADSKLRLVKHGAVTEESLRDALRQLFGVTTTT